MDQKQAGFTLIELVMVIVILGILAAVAIPKFIDLSDDAKTAAVKGVAGALSSAAAVNYAARSASTNHGVAITSCNGVSNAASAIPSGASLSTAAVTAGATDTACVVTLDGKTANFVAIGIL